MDADLKKTMALIRSASPFEYLFVLLMLLPPLLIAWLGVTEKLKFTDDWAVRTTGAVLIAYCIAGVLLLMGSLRQRSRKVACLQILGYLDSHQFRMMSFERIRKNINTGYSDGFLGSVIHAFPELLRPAKLKGQKQGVAKLYQVRDQDPEEGEE
jgi:hypothetical protein